MQFSWEQPATPASPATPTAPPSVVAPTIQPHQFSFEPQPHKFSWERGVGQVLLNTGKSLIQPAVDFGRKELADYRNKKLTLGNSLKNAIQIGGQNAIGYAQDVARLPVELGVQVAQSKTNNYHPVQVKNQILQKLLGTQTITPPQVEQAQNIKQYGTAGGALATGIHKGFQAAPLLSLLHATTGKTQTNEAQIAIQRNPEAEIKSSTELGKQYSEFPKEQLFQSNGELQPSFAEGRVSDIAQKLDDVKPGLGKQFSDSVDLSHTTLSQLQSKALDLLPQKSSPLIDAAPFRSLTTLADKTKNVAKDIRSEHSGHEAAQVQRGNTYIDKVVKPGTSIADRQAAFWLNEVKGNTAVLERAIQNPDQRLDVTTDPSSRLTIRQQIQHALDNRQSVDSLRQKVAPLYQQIGQASEEKGIIQGQLDQYNNRLYQPEKVTSTGSLRSQLPQSDIHTRERVFPTALDAVLAKSGSKRIASSDLTDLAKSRNQDFAKVYTNAKLVDHLKSTGIGIEGETPNNFTKLPGTSLSIPKPLANGLRVLTDPNYLKGEEQIMKFQSAQSLIKAGKLSLSFFHHFNIAKNFLAANVTESLHHPVQFVKTFNELRDPATKIDFLQHGGELGNIDATPEAIRTLASKDTLIGKVGSLPVLKQGKQLLTGSNKVLFQRMIPWAKEFTYQAKVQTWLADHPDATPQAVIEAKRGFAEFTNQQYGGLNWTVLGRTPTTRAVLRSILLAPDWLESNVRQLSGAFKGGTLGSASRQSLVTGLIAGATTLEVVQHAISGHYTSGNDKGHEFELQIGPGTYIPVFPSGITEGLKLLSQVKDKGALAGAAAYLQNKAAPGVRIGLGFAKNTDSNSKPIVAKSAGPVENTLSAGKYLASEAAPIPIGVGNVQKSEKESGFAKVLTGLGISTTSPRSIKNVKTGEPSLDDLLSNKNKSLDTVSTKVNGKSVSLKLKGADQQAYARDVLSAIKDTATQAHKLSNWNDFTPEGKKKYLSDLLNNKLRLLNTKYKDKGQYPTTFEQSKDAGNLKTVSGSLRLVDNYIKAFTTNPSQAASDLFGPEHLRKVDKGVVVQERQNYLSEKNPAPKGQEKTQVDHLIPLELGGTNSPLNLKRDQNFPAKENYYKSQVSSGKMKPKEAVKALLQYKLDQGVDIPQVYRDRYGLTGSKKVSLLNSTLGIKTANAAELPVPKNNTEKLANHIARLEGYTKKGTLADRQNNPGNLVFSGQTGATNGTKGFAKFSSPEAGIKALIAQIKKDAARDLNMRQFVYKYAPPTSNNSAAYLQSILRSLGVKATTKLSSL